MFGRRLEPGTYEVTWSLPSADGTPFSAPGRIDLVPHHPPTGTIQDGDFIDWHQAERGLLLQPFTLSQLAGTLPSGHVVHLRGADVVPVGPQAAVRARVALVGDTALESSQDTIDSLLIQVEGVNDVFAGASPERGLLGKGAVTASIVIVPDVAPGSTREARAIRLEFKVPHELDHAIAEYVEPIRRVVSVGLGTTAHITALTVGVTAVPHTAPEVSCDVFAAGLGQDVEWTSPGGSYRKPALVMDANEPTLLDMLRRWSVLQGRQHPLIDLFGASIFIRDLHPRNRFLIAMQTLEGAWASDNQPSLAAAQADYTRERSAAVKELRRLKVAHLSFLEQALSSRRPQALDDAIRDYCAEFLEDLDALLLEVETITVLTSSGDADDAVDALRIIRNHLSHGERTYPIADLGQIARVLDRAIRAKLLNELGASPAAQARALEAPEDEGPTPVHG